MFSDCGVQGVIYVVWLPRRVLVVVQGVIYVVSLPRRVLVVVCKV